MTSQPTDTQLKQALALMVPEDIKINCWNNLVWIGREGYDVLDTELLHLCWMVEESMSAELYINKYIEALYLECGNGRAAAHASWQQRTIALCKVKGVEIV